MQSVSELWRSLRAMPGTEVEYRFDVNGVTYGREAEVSHEVNHALYTEFGFGNASCAGLTLQLYADTIPKSAKIQRFCRLVNGEQASEWLPAGVYYTSHRSEEDGFWEIEAFDDMRKAEKVWNPDQALEFPMPMDEAVAEICRVLGFTLDDRSEISHTYTLDYPQSEQTFRQTLKWIAAAHGGNWIFTPAGKLRLVSILAVTEDIHYLVDENRRPIIFGDTCIWVSDVGAHTYANSEGESHYIGLDLFTTRNNGKRKPVSRITLLTDDENAYTAGDDTGLELVADCPYATQTMANALLAKLAGYEYQAYSAEGANLDPAAELGDGVRADGTFFVLASIREDGSGYPDIAAPGDVEREEEYPEGNYSDQVFNRKLAQTRSLISKSAEQIRLEVQGMEEQLSAMDISLDEITLVVAGLDEGMTAIEQTLSDITLSVSNENGTVSIQLKSGDSDLGTAGTIDMTGVVTFSALSGAPGEGTTTINGGWIDTDTLNVTFADIEGRLKSNRIDLYSDLTVYTDSKLEDVGGKIGYGTSLIDGSYGIHIQSVDADGGFAGNRGEFIATANGVKMVYGDNYQVYLADNDGSMQFAIEFLGTKWITVDSLAGVHIEGLNLDNVKVTAVYAP